MSNLMTEVEIRRLKQHQDIVTRYEEMRGEAEANQQKVSRWRLCTAIAPMFTMTPNGVSQILKRFNR